MRIRGLANGDSTNAEDIEDGAENPILVMPEVVTAVYVNVIRAKEVEVGAKLIRVAAAGQIVIVIRRSQSGVDGGRLVPCRKLVFVVGNCSVDGVTDEKEDGTACGNIVDALGDAWKAVTFRIAGTHLAMKLVRVFGKKAFVPIGASVSVGPLDEKVRFLHFWKIESRMLIQIAMETGGSAFHESGNDEIRTEHQSSRLYNEGTYGVL